MKPGFRKPALLLVLAPLLALLATAGNPAQAATKSEPARLPMTQSVTTNCHWHTDGNVYWAHCYPTGTPYTFQMHIWCDHTPYPIPPYENDSDIAQSPQQIYTNGINCIFGGSVTSAWVTAG